MKENLLRKGHKEVANYMKRYGYVIADNYEEGDNYIVELAKICAGTTVKSVVVTFNSNWRVIKVA